MEQTKKKNVPLAILKVFGIILLSIIVVILLWVAFSALDRKKASAAIPSDFSVYVRTDSVWDSAEPLLDLQAVEILLANPSLSSARTMFLNFRSSSLRNNFFVKMALRRRIDLSVYENSSYLAVLDLGELSSVTRLFPLAYKTGKIQIPYFTQFPNEDLGFYYVYAKDQVKIYVKPKKNFVFVTSDFDLLKKACSLQCASEYSEKSIETVNSRLTEPFMIAVDGKKLTNLIKQNSKTGEIQNAFLDYIFNHLSSDNLSRINFGISDTDISLRADFNFESDEEFQQHPMGNIISKNSTTPSILTRLSQNVQYYTLINASSLEEIKNAAFSAVPQKINIDSIWKTADGASKMLFGMGLDEVLFSWTGGEYALCGIEGKSEPVFVAKIQDEEKRQYIFDNILASAIFKSNDSLLIDGVRLPRIEIPQALQNVLTVFGINLPKPYYLVKDGFIYFSQSPENLVTMNAVRKNSFRLVNSENWKRISENQSSTSTLSLFYNLERSVPFFLKNNSTFANILKLYHIGRFDVSSKNSVLSFELDATSIKTTDSKTLPGFPVALGSEKKSMLKKSQSPNSNQVYFLEGDKIHAFNTFSLEDICYEVEGVKWIETAAYSSKSKGDLWVMTQNGTVYLFDKDLNVMPNFPVLASVALSAPVANGTSLIYVPENENNLVSIDEKGAVSKIEVGFENVVSSPATNSKGIALYDKSFFGELIYLKDKKISSVPVLGIGFGSPQIADFGKYRAICFLTQSGDLFVSQISSEEISEQNLQQFTLEGVFNLNVKIAKTHGGSKIVALSEDGNLYSIDIFDIGVPVDEAQGQEIMEFPHVKIPYFTAKTGYVTVTDYDGDGEDEIFVCGDGNMIYGFKNDLNMMEGFPVSGYGNVVFIDVNGDNKKDCLTLSLDNKLYAYKIE
ncbi:MAG: VCBS repeat-containing protein [Treponemataceae bacterium]|nr:VCBS repeat-containing protein [Treponemataceae bacterium]